MLEQVPHLCTDRQQTVLERIAVLGLHAEYHSVGLPTQVWPTQVLVSREENAVKMLLHWFLRQ